MPTTPMQYLKNQFDTFKSYTKDIGFEELTLNKSEPKTGFSSWCGETFLYNNRGVSSDFIKLFRIKFNKENAYSIGFKFSYLDRPEGEQSVTISLKKGEKDFFCSPNYTIQDFKEIFNELLKKIQIDNNLNYKKIIDLLEADFQLAPSVHQYKKNRKYKN